MEFFELNKTQTEQKVDDLAAIKEELTTLIPCNKQLNSKYVNEFVL